MSRCTNREVVRLWSYGDEARNHRGTLWTDGRNLYSYNLRIGFTSPHTHKNVVIEYTAPSGGFHSVTTSTHVGYARSRGDYVIRPDSIKNMNLPE